MDDLDVELVNDTLDQRNPLPRIFRDRTNPLDLYNDDEFRRRYRLTRTAFMELVSQMEVDLEKPTNRSNSFSTSQRLAIALRVFASNEFQLNSGDLLGASQSSVSRIVAVISDWFHNNVGSFVSWHTEESAKNMQKRVLQKFGLPFIVGAIDGTHIRIQSPEKIREFNYMNRKQYHSINVVCVVDDQFNFLWFNSQFPGGSHDSFIFRQSQLCQAFEDGSISGKIVGDSAFRAETYMLKIVMKERLTAAEKKYNDAICTFRVCVEQSFGQLKRQWHILHGELRYTPERASRIVAACISLRNYAKFRNIPDFDDDDFEDIVEEKESESESDGEEGTNESDTNITNGNATITSIVNNYFT